MVERLEPWIDGPTCSDYRGLQAQNCFPEAFAYVDQYVGASEGWEAHPGRSASNFHASKQRNYYWPPGVIRVVHRKGGAHGSIPRPAWPCNATCPSSHTSYVNHHTCLQDKLSSEYQPWEAIIAAQTSIHNTPFLERSWILSLVTLP
jgi:hypothetical protein